MAISCKASCKNCKLYSTQQPFRLVQLNSGYAMPAVGFGTAGLGIGTAAAVQYAVSAGYRLIDTAEVRHLQHRADVCAACCLLWTVCCLAAPRYSVCSKSGGSSVVCMHAQPCLPRSSKVHVVLAASLAVQSSRH